MKKRFLASLVLIPLLGACGTNPEGGIDEIKQPELPEGGTVVDLSKEEDAANLAAKIDAACAANATASLTTGGKAELNLNKIDLSVLETIPQLPTPQTIVNISNLTGSLEAGVGGLNGTYADLAAFAKIKNLNGNVSAMGYNVPLANLDLAAYLKSGAIYADASDPAIKATVQGVAATIYTQEATVEGQTPTKEQVDAFVDQFTTLIESVVGPNWKVAVPGLFSEEMMQEKVVPNLPTASYFEGIGEVALGAIDEIGVGDFLTFKIYDDGSFGAALKAGKDDVLSLIPEEELGGVEIKEFDLAASVLFDKDLHLKSVNYTTKAEVNVDEGDGYAIAVKTDINLSLNVQLGIDIASYIPTDLASYTVLDLDSLETPIEE